MGDQEEYDHARLSLSVFIQAVFNEAKVLDARDWQVFAGLGQYARTAAPPNGVVDTARAVRLGVVSRYTTVIPKVRAATSTGDGGVGSLNLPIHPDAITRDQVRLVPSFFIRHRADLVWDDEAELTASEFLYTNVATQLSTPVRKQVYGDSLSKVQPPADSGNTGFFDNGSTFYVTAATQATYDLADAAQPYYPKWLAPNPVAAKDRRFTFDALSDRYLQLNYLPYDLEKGFVHLYLEIDAISVVVKLFRENEQLHYDAIFGQGVPRFGDYFDIIRRYVALLKSKHQKVQGTATFVYSFDGTDHAPRFTQLEDKLSANLSLNMMAQVVDPQAVVQATRGMAINAIDDLQKTWTPRDWLREMVRLRFSEPWVWFWKNADIQMFYQIDRDRLFLDDLRAAQKTATGPLKQTLDDFIKTANADPNLYLVRRGSQYGPDKRVMGSDDSYVYFYDNRNKLVTRLPMFVFWRDQNVSQIERLIYQNTRGMIPIIKAITWTGTVVMSWGIVGTDVLVDGFKDYVGEYVTDKITSIATNKLIAETFKKFKLRLMALLILPILDLLGKKLFGRTTAGARIFAFLEGFAEGFTEHAFQAIINRWQSVLTLEPASYRAVKLLMRIEGILRWVDEKMSALKDYLSKTVAEALSNRFVSVAVQAGTGLVALIDALYFLDYKQAKGFLELYADIAGVPVPSEADWNQWRHRHLLETFKHYKAELISDGKDVAELYNDVQGAVHTAMRAVSATEYAVGAIAVTNFALAGGLVPLMLLVLKGSASKVGAIARTKPGQTVAAGAAGGFVAVLLLNDDFMTDVLEFVGNFGKAAGSLGSGAARTADFAWSTPERMQRFGALLGVIVASITISKAVIKKGKWQERWKSEKNVVKFWGKETLRNQLYVNPLLPGLKLALYHYVRLVEEVITDSNAAWADFEDQVEKILLGDVGDTLRGIVIEDQGITLPKLIAILKLGDDLLLKWLKQLATTPGLTDQISYIADKLESIGPSQLPSLDQIRNGSMSQIDWLKEALMYVILTHLQGGLNLLVQALQSMLDPVNPKDPNPVSVGFVLQTLGFNLDEAEATAALDRNFEDVFKDQAS